MDKMNYKRTPSVCLLLETALKKEWEKYAATPVTPDMLADFEAAQAWGYVIAGYFLLEQGFKSVLKVRGGQPRKIHSLSVLFVSLPKEDQDVLHAYYDDFYHTFPGMSSFPIKTLENFLANLDGAKPGQVQHQCSFDWRYFLTEKATGAMMPLVSINIMHEIVYACVQLIESIDKGNNEACRSKYSLRLWQQRLRIQQDWLMVRMNSPNWGQEGERLEILWGPAYGDRYDYMIFKGDRIQARFAPLPDAEEAGISIQDKRVELASFNPEEGFRSIGVTGGRLVKNRESKSGHVMFF